MTIENVESYFRAYDKRRYQVVAQQGAEPDEGVISEFERAIGFRLPEEFREFSLHPLGGLFMEAREEVWPTTERFAVGPFWSFLRGLMVYGFSAQAPDWLSIEPTWREMKEEGYPHLVPFLKVIGDGDPYCFSSSGGIVIWRHEEPDDPEPFDGGFYAALLHEISELDDRVERKLRGEDRE